MISAAARAVLAGLALAATAALAQPADARRNAEDFDALWKAVDQSYPYFESRAAWRRARDTWRPRAARAASRGELAAALEGLLAELRDDHASLSERTARRRVPMEADLWGAWKDNAATVESVRTFGDADVAGLRPGDVVVRIDGVPAERAVRERLGKGAVAGPAARDWALRQVLAGPRTGALSLELRSAGSTRRVDVERRDAASANGPPILSRRIGMERDLGYLRIKSSLDDPQLVKHFDAALTMLRGTRAMIIDLREVTGGSSHAATLAILGRFTAAAAPWQVREGADRKRETDVVQPRGLPYVEPMVVLVDRWTAGEGEALAAGLAAVAKARLLGTPMAGLRGELREVRLPHSGIVARFPAEKVLTPGGTPRERLLPSVPVDLVGPQAGPGDPILYKALKLLER
ncbi:MAG TPA: S41 family peptidase [Usitatibacter sp.]|nr:S41 family peptidase [Usitatibacter sp.]